MNLEDLIAAVADDEETERFLDAIRQTESSGGKNTRHPVVTKGLNKGDRAIGEFAFMPLTIFDVIRWNPDDLSYLKGMTPDEIRRVFEADKGLERGAARAHAKWLKKRRPDPAERAFAWNEGPWRKPANLESHNYVKKFMKAYKPPRMAEGEQQ